MNIKKNILFFSQFITGQLLLQFFNLLNGFFLLRWLSINEQAKFSVAFSIQSLILSLSDLGFTGSIVALVGQRVNDKKIVGGYINAARKLRNYLFFFSCGVTLFIVPFIIKEQSWGYIEMLIILTPVLLAVFWQADCSLYDSTLVMNHRMKDLYKPQVLLSVTKFLLNYVLYFFGVIGAFTTLLLNAFTLLINGRTFKKAAKPYTDLSNNDTKNVKEMVAYMKPLLPSLVFNAFFGQLQIFLISFFGTSSNIAEVAALGRLSQIFIFLSSLNGVIVTPLIAKKSSQNLTNAFFKVISFSILVITIILLITYFFPELFLFLLGSKYYHLKQELSIIMLNSCFAYLANTLWCMSSARKWLFWWGTFSYIGSIIVTQIIGIAIFNLSTTSGVLKLSLLSTVGILLVHILILVFGLLKENNKIPVLNFN